MTIEGVLDGVATTISGESFEGYVDQRGNALVTRLGFAGWPEIQSVQLGERHWSHFPGFGWVETESSYWAGDSFFDQTDLDAAIASWLAPVKSDGRDEFSRVDLTPVLHMIPLSQDIGVDADQVLSAIGDVSIGEDEIGITGEVTGPPEMIRVRGNFAEDIQLRIWFTFRTSRAENRPITKPAEEALLNDGHVRFESRDLDVTFAVPAALAGGVVIEIDEYGPIAWLNSWGKYPSQFLFLLRKLPERPAPITEQWVGYVEGIGGHFDQPPQEALTEQPGAYGLGVINDEEHWFGTVHVGDQLVAVSVQSDAIEESDFVAFLLSLAPSTGTAATDSSTEADL